MKNFYTIAFSLLIGSLFAQNSFGVYLVGTTNYIAPNTILKATTTPSAKTTVTLDIRNTSSSSHSYMVRRYDVLLNKSTVDTAKAFFCFAGTCYGTNMNEPNDVLVLKPGQSGIEAGIEADTDTDPTNNYFHLDADIIEAATVGISHVKYTFWDYNNASDSIQIAIRYNDPYVGLKEANKKSSRIEMFPNPGSDFTTITLESSNDQPGQLRVFSSIGTVVFEKQIVSVEGTHSFDLDLHNLAAGVYIVQLKEGNTSTTKKLVVQK